jgi:tetratricopeptide (TPR) repeat protein
VDAYYEGRWQEALEHYDRSKALRERIGDVVGAATITNNIGEIKSDQGYLTTAAALAEEAREVFANAGHRLLLTHALSNLGRIAARGGELDDAQRLLNEALGIAEDISSTSLVLEVKARLAEWAVLARQPEAALEGVEDVLAGIRESGGGSLQNALVHRIRGNALERLGQADEALAAFEQSLQLAREADETYELAVTLEAIGAVKGRAGRDGSAEAAEARGLLARLGVVSTPAMPL